MYKNELERFGLDSMLSINRLNVSDLATIEHDKTLTKLPSEILSDSIGFLPPVTRFKLSLVSPVMKDSVTSHMSWVNKYCDRPPIVLSETPQKTWVDRLETYKPDEQQIIVKYGPFLNIFLDTDVQQFLVSIKDMHNSMTRAHNCADQGLIEGMNVALSEAASHAKQAGDDVAVPTLSTEVRNSAYLKAMNDALTRAHDYAAQGLTQGMNVALSEAASHARQAGDDVAAGRVDELRQQLSAGAFYNYRCHKRRDDSCA